MFTQQDYLISVMRCSLKPFDLGKKEQHISIGSWPPLAKIGSTGINSSALPGCQYNVHQHKKLRVQCKARLRGSGEKHMERVWGYVLSGNTCIKLSLHEIGCFMNIKVGLRGQELVSHQFSLYKGLPVQPLSS